MNNCDTLLEEFGIWHNVQLMVYYEGYLSDLKDSITEAIKHFLNEEQFEYT